LKIAVIASPEDGQFLLGILETLERSKVPAYGLKIRENWKRLARGGIVSRLEKATHFILVATPASLETTWFAFATGYGHGHGSIIAFYRLDASFALPGFVSGLPVIDTLDELGAYCGAEMAEWEYREERRSARASLLEMGISTHAGSLAQCVRDGDRRAVEHFLRAGFVPDSRDKHGVPLLCLAARSRHRALAELLLEAGASIDLQSEDRGYSALMDAVLVGSVDLVEFLLAKGADPDLVSKDGQSAIVVAVGRGDRETIRLLLDHGADPDLADKLGLSARKYAQIFKQPEVSALFRATLP
jgi:hypothetical protein